MFTDFAVRNRWMIVPLIVSACLVAFFWAGLSREGIARPKNTELVNSYDRSPDDHRLIAVGTKTLCSSRTGDADGFQKVVSGEVESKFTAPEWTVRTPQWPRQIAGAYCSLENSNGIVAPFRRLVESGLSLEFLSYRKREAAHNRAIPENNEAPGVISSMVFRWNGFHQHSPTSQGSVLVNF